MPFSRVGSIPARILGSVSSSVLDQARCPVAVVPARRARLRPRLGRARTGSPAPADTVLVRGGGAGHCRSGEAADRQSYSRRRRPTVPRACGSSRRSWSGTRPLCCSGWPVPRTCWWSGRVDAAASPGSCWARPPASAPNTQRAPSSVVSGPEPSRPRARPAAPSRAIAKPGMRIAQPPQRRPHPGVRSEGMGIADFQSCRAWRSGAGSSRPRTRALEAPPLTCALRRA